MKNKTSDKPTFPEEEPERPAPFKELLRPDPFKEPERPDPFKELLRPDPAPFKEPPLANPVLPPHEEPERPAPFKEPDWKDPDWWPAPIEEPVHEWTPEERALESDIRRYADSLESHFLRVKAGPDRALAFKTLEEAVQLCLKAVISQ